MQTIFVVEDDTNIRELVIYALKGSQYNPIGFDQGTQVVKQARELQPSLILLDIMLPGESGLHILSQLKRSKVTQDIPVIMITAKIEEFDRVSGLDMGADDYVTKPFSVLELLARVRAVLRRSGEEKAQTFSLGGIFLDPQKRQVEAHGKQITLTYKEFELLQYMMEHEGIVLDRERLLARVWGFDFSGETRTVDMHIKTLRQKLGDAGKSIKTVRGVGYTIEENAASQRSELQRPTPQGVSL